MITLRVTNKQSGRYGEKILAKAEDWAAG